VRRAILVFGTILLLTGCARSRAGDGPDLLSLTAVPAPSALKVTSPAPGGTIVSPVSIRGTLDGGDADTTLAAQVLSREDDGALRWRGNGLLTVDAGGTFQGEIAYSLATPGPGVVEVLVIDPVEGTARERRQVPVTLSATE
jgi:hypothetical protein